MEWLQTIIGVLLGGTLSLLGGYIAHRREHKAAIERLKMEPLARSCNALVQRLERPHQWELLGDDHWDPEHGSDVLPIDEVSSLVGQIDYWLSDKEAFDKIMGEAYTELTMGWPRTSGDMRTYARELDALVAYRSSLTSSLTKLPFRSEKLFHEDLRAAIDSASRFKHGRYTARGQQQEPE